MAGARPRELGCRAGEAVFNYHQRMIQFRNIVVANLAVFAVLLAVLELGLRAVGMGPGSFFNYSRYFAEGYYPINYYEAHSVRGFDIAPNVPDTPFRFADATTTVFSNTIGCLDRNTPTALAAGRYALLVGDSFAWGFAPFEDKWGTLVEQETGIPIAKCGVSHTGQRHQLDKARDVVAAVGLPPALVIVGYYVNDPVDDVQFPASTVFRDALVDFDGLLETPAAEVDLALTARYESWQAGQRSLTNRIRNHSAAANAIWAVVKRARDRLGSSSRNLASAMLSIDDYMPHGKYAAHGQALLDLRDWSEQTAAELLIILTPGKNVDGKTYDGTKACIKH